MPAIEGGFGDTPVFLWPDTAAPEGLQVEVLSEGDGPEVAEGAFVVANYAGYVWGSADPFDSSFDRGAPSGFSLAQVVEGWSQGIPGHALGSRLLISIPPDLGYGSQGNPNAGIGGTDTIVFVVDIVESAETTSMGEPDATPADAADAPVTLDGALGEPVSIAVDDGAEEPAEAAVYPVSVGSGGPVELGQSVLLSYALSTWDGAQSYATWDEAQGAGPETFSVADGSPFALLAGQTVGSRVVLVLPGDAAGTPAQAVVLDILAAF